jgi:hypothetical protein
MFANFLSEARGLHLIRVKFVLELVPEGLTLYSKDLDLCLSSGKAKKAGHPLCWKRQFVYSPA